MKTASAFIVVVSLSVVAGAQTVPQLAGVWKLDPARSGIALGPNVREMTLTIKQTDNEVVLSRDVVQEAAGPRNVAKLTYRIGEVATNAPEGVSETATAVWSNKGRLVISGERIRRNGVATRFQLIVGLSADGRELVMEDEEYLWASIGSTASSRQVLHSGGAVDPSTDSDSAAARADSQAAPGSAAEDAEVEAGRRRRARMATSRARRTPG